MNSLLSSFVLTLSFSALIYHGTGQIHQTSNHSSWMASSIISRGQGIMTGQGGSSELLQAGITQKAFSRLIQEYPYDSSRQNFESYITKSVDSTTSFISNATRDASYPLDRLSIGDNLISLYERTGNQTYKQNFQSLRTSIDLQSRNAAGGLWYYIYPNWSYLDGMYSLAPFYTLHTNLYNANNSSDIEDIFFQLDILWNHCYDNSTSLLFHGYDFSKTAVWASPFTGASPHVWGRGLGWYIMAMVDTLEASTLSHQSSEWKNLEANFQHLSSAVAKAVDQASGAWWQVLDQPGRVGNYIESSGSAMFVYSLLKGTRLGYLLGYERVATRAYQYIVNSFVIKNGSSISYNGTVAVCSLNSTASFEYYVSQPILYDSVLGSASFVLASLEIEIFTAAI